MPTTPLAVLRALRRRYYLHTTALDYKNEWQLLVAIILSAQCTDARVNMVTPVLFKALPRVQDYVTVPQAKLEKLIYSTGFYRNKAKNIKAAASALVSEHKGKIPDSMDALVEIPGVGRKTANVFLRVAHEKAEGIVVDTHIFRVSRRTGAASGKTPEQVERELMEGLPRKHWIAYGDLAIQHGRVLCHARKPDCANCPLKTKCPSAFKL